MSLHKRAIQIECSKDGCEHRAMCEVFNDRNSSIGKFCAYHANELIRLDTTKSP